MAACLNMMVFTKLKVPQPMGKLCRLLSSTAGSTFKFNDLQIQLCSSDKKCPKPDPKTLLFGRSYTDHMFEVEWTSDKGWGTPVISPLHNLVLHPGAKVFHYAVELFEGMKAFRTEKNHVVLFRPDMNIKRLLTTAERTSLPTFDGKEFLNCLRKLVSIEKDWVPAAENCSLYIRPTFFGTEQNLGVSASNKALLYIILCPVGPYYPTGFKPVSLLADPQFVRAWPGGCGDKKMGSNYAPTIAIQKYAEKLGFQQILWLFGKEHYITEVGTMNIFIFLKNERGERELITPPLEGLILPGVTRQSLLDLTREKYQKELKVIERNITMAEVVQALEQNRLLEIFGSGTACVVCPVSSINYNNTNYTIPTMEQKDPLFMKLLKELNDIQYGNVNHHWSVDVE